MSGSQNQLTGQLEIAALARQSREMKFTSLNKHLTKEWLRRAYDLTRKDGALGIDGQSGEDYAVKLEENLANLLERAKSGSYVAPPVRRVYLPKSDGSKRGLGIPTFEDKVLQRAITMLLEAIYEEEFLDCSYGFRPGRSAVQASQAVHDTLYNLGECFVIDVDVKKYFDTIEHGILRELLGNRVNDGVINRLIGKWLSAGVWEEGTRKRQEKGSPQGCVISPLLSNVYLHNVLDKWFEEVVKPRLTGKAELFRYADDFVIIVKNQSDAEQIFSVLGKRFDKYGLQLHEEKTQVVDFKPGASFNFLGFTYYWGRSRWDKMIPKRKTAKDRTSRMLKAIRERCMQRRHEPLIDQNKHLNRVLQGIYNYFGVTGNIRSLKLLHNETSRHWFRALNRRSQQKHMTWEKFRLVLDRFPLKAPYIPNSIYI